MDSLRWLTTRRELENILAAWRWASANDQESSVVRFARSLGPYLMQRGYWDTCMTLLTEGIDAALNLSDRVGDLSLRLLRGLVERILGNFDGAERLLLTSIEISRQIGADVQEAYSKLELGIVARTKGQYEDADDLLSNALEFFTATYDLRGQSYARREIGEL